VTFAYKEKYQINFVHFQFCFFDKFIFIRSPFSFGSFYHISFLPIFSIEVLGGLKYLDPR